METQSLKNQSPRLEILNGENSVADLESVLEMSGIAPVTDFAEVQRTNQIYSLLLKNKEVRRLISNFVPQRYIPENEEEFLIFFFNPDPKKRLLFLKELEAFSEKLLSFSTNDDLSAILRQMNSLAKKHQVEEMQAAELIYESIEKATQINGSINFSYTADYEENENSDPELHFRLDSVREINVFGYRKNFYGLHNQIKLVMPAWMKARFWRFVGLYDYVKKNRIEKINEINRINSYKDYLIKEIPRPLIADIAAWLQENILKYKTLRNLFHSGDTLDFEVFFYYDGKKLLIRLVDINSNLALDGIEFTVDYRYLDLIDDKDGATQRKLQSYEVSILNHLSEKHKKLFLLKKLSRAFNVKSIRNFFYGTSTRIDSRRTDVSYKFTDVSYLYGLPEVKDVFQRAEKLREFVSREVGILKEMVKTIEHLMALSSRWNIPLSMPTVVDGNNIVAFNTLYPIQLIGQDNVDGKELKARNLKVIKNLPKLNGQLIGLTGQNAGGKTVTHETILNAIYMAQAGLPVFGTGFIFNPKDFVGTLFLERGQGSTMQLQIRKTRDIFRAIDNLHFDRVLVILDEVGTGTSHEEGEKYGKEILESVYVRKVSCIFTTQFSNIAEFAEKELNALNFQLTHNHTIKPGIGKPNLKRLIRKEGLTPFLKKKA